MGYILLHNPRCSKSCAALALLEEQKARFTVREYLIEPLSLDELRILRKKLDRPVAEWLRWDQEEAKGLSKTATGMELLAVMAMHPILMERPILIKGDRAMVGRPGVDVLVAML